MNADRTGNGLFLVLEGVEGSGKTTQRDRLAEWLAQEGLAHRVTREPGGTPLGEEIRRLILRGGHVEDRAELLLLLAARATLVGQEIRPGLAAGEIVVADRYALSTLAYQGYGRGMPLDEVRALNAFATGGLQPDLTIVLDVPTGVGVARLGARTGGADRIEAEGGGFHERVAEAYRLLASSEPRTRRIDGTGSPAGVHRELRGLLREMFPETFAATPG
ncbi:MAG: dTMP kinase [Gemmatimonadetes bacterium]|nr:dTMP kinase [Gemmatimonadota bacterium]